jgi:hypothetical protein
VYVAGRHGFAAKCVPRLAYEAHMYSANACVDTFDPALHCSHVENGGR